MNLIREAPLSEYKWGTGAIKTLWLIVYCGNGESRMIGKWHLNRNSRCPISGGHDGIDVDQRDERG